MLFFCIFNEKLKFLCNRAPIRAQKKFQIIMTKVDLVEAEDLARRYTLVREEMKNRKFKYFLDRIMMVSSTTNAGVNNLKKELASLAYRGPQPMPRLALSSSKFASKFGINSSAQKYNPKFARTKTQAFLKRGRAKQHKVSDL
jgi:tRNA U34 5-carboxymethylaminomethyl modifying GTPase MnmE/TrmE